MYGLPDRLRPLSAAEEQVTNIWISLKMQLKIRLQS